MEDTRLDHLAKTLANPVSRRRATKLALATAIGGVLGLGGIRDSVSRAASCGGFGEKCNKNDKCCSGFCDPSTGACGCSTGTTPCNGACVPTCPTGQVLTGDCQCICGPGTVPCGSGCGPLCTGGKVLNPTTCQCECPPGGSLCACTPNGQMTLDAASCCSRVYDITTQTCQRCVQTGDAPFPQQSSSCCSGSLGPPGGPNAGLCVGA